MKNMQKQELKASITIEMSLIMPFLIFLIWNLLYLSFFVYNQSTMLQGNYCTALRIERCNESELEKNELAEKKYKEAVLDKLVCAESEKKIEVSEKEVAVTTHVGMRAPGEGFLKSVWQIEQRQKADVYRPAAFIRLCRSAENIMDVIRGEGKG